MTLFQFERADQGFTDHARMLVRLADIADDLRAGQRAAAAVARDRGRAEAAAGRPVDPLPAAAPLQPPGRGQRRSRRGRSGSSARSSTSSGASSSRTSADLAAARARCPRPRALDRAVPPSARGRGRDRSTPAPARSSATSSPSGSWGCRDERDGGGRRAASFRHRRLDPLVPLAREAEARRTSTASGRRSTCTATRSRGRWRSRWAPSTINVGTGHRLRVHPGAARDGGAGRRCAAALGGRFGLGISTGTRGVRRWYGADSSRPPRGSPSTCRRCARRGPRTPTCRRRRRSTRAALNPIMTRTVARDCDGVLLHALALSRVHLHERRPPRAETGRARRSAADPARGRDLVHHLDRRRRRTRARARPAPARLLPLTPSYRTVAEGTPWEGAVARRPAGVRPTSGRTAELGELRRADPRRGRRRAHDLRHPGRRASPARRARG